MNAVSKVTNVLRFKKAGPKHHSAAHANTQCGNCSTKINGNFCHVCGQSAHVHHSLLHLIEEMVHGLWHFDAKGWRTIPMLFAFPGELTRRYIDGQRVRFISPLALFLFTVFFMFFMFSLTGSHNQDKEDSVVKFASTSIEQGLGKDLELATTNVDKAQANLLAAQKNGGDVSGSQHALDEAIEKQKVRQKDVGQTNEFTDHLVLGGMDLKEQQWVKKTIKHAIDNPEIVAYKMKNNAYKFALLLVPISLPFLWLMFFWRKGITMFDHAVFSFYSLSFMALWVSMMNALIAFHVTSAALIVLAFLPPIHMYRQLKSTYQLSHLSTLWRTVFLSFIACILLTIFMLFVAAVSAT
ncbi:hypothetical protein S2091_3967 [Solimicrobium silvestre]|uniref:DUF3667 domain-containing protein n=2 Tax=Solimicrobium silvestre TaxID=2099400 RepID=A0A2S9GUG2_9BURK|nr:hypothetical protein S2091_3967 [Solimicrobium silvestre]